jgi:alkylhydroperoxidase/carboxymuconolactone decarboxylase family protein YurZ
MSPETAHTEARLRSVTSGQLQDHPPEASGLDPEAYHLVRIAALAAVGGGLVAWVSVLDAADEANVDVDKIVGTLVAVAPLIGAPRVMAAGANIGRATGLAETDHLIPSA